MRDQVRDSKFDTPVHFRDDSVHRLLVEFLLGTGKVRKVWHVVDYWSEAGLPEFFAEAPDFFRV